MYWHCETCDNIMIAELKNKHLKSKFHNSFVNSIIRRYIITNPLPNKIYDIIRKHLRIHYEKYNKFQVVLLLKFLMPSNQNKYIRIHRSSRHYRLRLPNAFFFSKMKNIKEQFHSQILEVRISFASLSKNMPFVFYLTQPKSMLEWKLLAKVDKKHEIVCLFDYRHCSRPLFREYFDILLDEFY